MHLIEDMCLRQGVIKATPNRKCYTWYVKLYVLDSNCWCLNAETMHLGITCLRWRALTWNLKTLLSSKRVWFTAITYSWHRKWSHSSSMTGLSHIMRLQSCEKAMGWCTALTLAKYTRYTVAYLWADVDRSPSITSWMDSEVAYRHADEE